MQVNTSPVQSSTDFNEGQNAFHPSHFFVHKTATAFQTASRNRMRKETLPKILSNPEQHSRKTSPSSTERQLNQLCHSRGNAFFPPGIIRAIPRCHSVLSSAIVIPVHTLNALPLQDSHLVFLNLRWSSRVALVFSLLTTSSCLLFLLNKRFKRVSDSFLCSSLPNTDPCLSSLGPKLFPHSTPPPHTTHYS